MRHKEEAILNGVHYVFVFKQNHEILFYVDQEKSERKYFPPELDDPLFWDGSPYEYTFQTCRVPCENPFLLKRVLLQFIDHALRKGRPWYFFFSSSDPDRFGLYQRFARLLCEKYGYLTFIEEQQYGDLKRVKYHFQKDVAQDCLQPDTP